MTHAAADSSDDDGTIALLEASWSERERRLPRRELLFEAGLTAVLIVGGIVLMGTTAVVPAMSLSLFAAMAVYALASRVAFPLGAGNVVPTQPFLLVLFALAPPMAVPLLVCVALATATVVHAALRRTHVERIVFAGGDALHAVGPALVLTLAGADQVTAAAWPVLALALVAQAVLDFGSSALREFVATGLKPEVQARVIAQVFAVDAALAPLGYLAALTLPAAGMAFVALVPLVALMAYSARDRLDGVARAHGRLMALRHERTRLRLAVRSVGEAFASNLDLDNLLTIVTRTISEALDVRAARTTVHLGGDSRFTCAGGDAHTPHTAALIDRVERLAADSQSGVQVTADGYSCLGLQIRGRQRPLATLVVLRRGEAFDEEEQDLVAYLGEQTAIAAANILRHEVLSHQAVMDEMTGLANHRRFQEVLREAVREHRDGSLVSSLVLLDLDNFKAVNDEHGHQFGDMVLRRVAACLTEQSRDGDVPARYGGEELALVARGAGEADAFHLAERVRREIAALSICTPSGRQVPVSVSVGVASLNAGRDTGESLIAAADAALYAAKRAGKNRVIVADAVERDATQRRDDVAQPLGGPPLTGDLPRVLGHGKPRPEVRPVAGVSSEVPVASKP